MMEKDNIAGKLRHRITLQRPVMTPNDSGGYIKTWKNITDVWGYLEPLAGKEIYSDGKLQASISQRITIRYRAKMSEEMRFVYAGRAYNIRSIKNIDERNILLEILAEEGVAV